MRLAYHAGAFSRADGRKVKPLAYYLERLRSDDDRSRGGMAILAELRSLKAAGLPVDIRRLN